MLAAQVSTAKPGSELCVSLRWTVGLLPTMCSAGGQDGRSGRLGERPERAALDSRLELIGLAALDGFDFLADREFLAERIGVGQWGKR